MIRWGRLGLVLLSLFAIWTAFGQALPGLPSASPNAPSGPPEDLASPRATMRTFLESVNAEDMSRARTTLNLSRVPGVEQESMGNRLARQMLQIINRTAFVDVDRIPLEVTEAWVFHRYRDASGDIVGSIIIARDPDGAWRFSAETIDAIPAIWEVVRDRPLVYGFEIHEIDFDPGGWLRRQVPENLQGDFLGLRLYQVLGLLGLLVIGALVDRIVRLLTQFLILFLLRVTKRNLEAKYKVNVRRNVGRFMGAWVVLLGVPFLALPLWLSAFFVGLFKLLRIVAGAAALWYLVDAALEAIQPRAAQMGERAQKLIFPFFSKVLQFSIAAGALLVTLAAFGLNVTAILAGLGIGGLVVALAGKDSVENFFGSLTILLDMPFAIGDWVKIGDIEGTVEEINLRSTRIRTFADSLITLPNSNLIKASVDNMGRRHYRRFRTTISLTYDTPPEKIEAFCAEVERMILAREDTRKENLFVVFNDLGASSLDVMLYMFFAVPNWSDELRARHEVLKEILAIGQRVGVSFAFPSRSIYFENALPATNATPPPEPDPS